jgi:hypothetical protein
MFTQGRLASLPGRPEIQHRLSGICSLGGVGISEVGSLNPGSFDAARCVPTSGKENNLRSSTAGSTLRALRSYWPDRLAHAGRPKRIDDRLEW